MLYKRIFLFFNFVFYLLLFGTCNSRINFIHIPKCGGTTIHSVLEKYFSVSEIYKDRKIFSLEDNKDIFLSGKSVSFLKRNKKLKETPNFENKLFISGHFPYWFFKEKDNNIENSINIISLREPISRYLSNIRYIQRIFPETQIDDSPENFICQILCSNPCLTGDELLNDCIQTLDSVDYIFFIDEIQDELPYLLECLGLTCYENKIPCINKNYIKDLSIDDETMKIIKQRNELDIKLYEYAVKNYMGKGNRKIKEKKQNFPSLKKLMETKTNFTYTFDLPIPGSGWYYRENVGTNQLVYSWIRGNKSIIHFNLNPSFDYVMQFQAHKLDEDIELKVEVNGYELNPKRLNHDWFSLYEVNIPKELLMTENTQISFITSHSYIYRDIYPKTLDSRSLSAALNLIKFFKR